MKAPDPGVEGGGYAPPLLFQTWRPRGWGEICLRPLLGIAHKEFSQRNFILTGSPRTLLGM